MPEPRSVIDASAMVDLLLQNPVGETVGQALAASTLHAPAHFDVEVLSALARLHRAGHLTEAQVEERLEQLHAAPIERHDATDLIQPAWAMRHNVRVTDSIYLALAAALDTRVVTTDRALARAAPDRARLVDPDAAEPRETGPTD
jgi:predicted nucleic acid-binding protein